jgi:hypothetical protein
MGKRGLTLSIHLVVYSYTPPCEMVFTTLTALHAVSNVIHHVARAHTPIAVMADYSAPPFAAVVKPDALLLHRRFGHVGLSILAKMA